MKFIDILQSGGPEALVLREAEAPLPAVGEVRIRVAAAGVNRPDVIQRMGLYPAPPGASPILGLEVAGEIDQVGEGVTDWTVGDKVCALVNGGGYAEQVCVSARQCLPVPTGVTLEEAAALPETCFTVWSNVFERAALKPGETFLVHGGSSGIGTTAIQMASLWGAQVYTTAGSAGKCNACRQLGALEAINYREQDFVEVLRAATSGKGVDVTLDMVGGDYIARNIKLAAMDGRIVNIAYLQGSVANVNFMPVMLKRLTLTGSTLRPQSTETKAKLAKALRQTVWPWIEAGRMRVVMSATFPLAQASAAHALMESNAHIGKIVLLT
ncbi:MAG: NAD(P)H-quinone oxidoreductase [Hahellaceae bacterium]|nr:NAD(P)H-quinone oxidoreductase [Hahellaceae bacterium]